MTSDKMFPSMLSVKLYIRELNILLHLWIVFTAERIEKRKKK